MEPSGWAFHELLEPSMGPTLEPLEATGFFDVEEVSELGVFDCAELEDDADDAILVDSLKRKEGSRQLSVYQLGPMSTRVDL